jgi:hypothetical protein
MIKSSCLKKKTFNKLKDNISVMDGQILIQFATGLVAILLGYLEFELKEFRKREKARKKVLRKIFDINKDYRVFFNVLHLQRESIIVMLVQIFIMLVMVILFTLIFSFILNTDPIVEFFILGFATALIVFDIPALFINKKFRKPDETPAFKLSSSYWFVRYYSLFLNAGVLMIFFLNYHPLDVQGWILQSAEYSFAFILPALFFLILELPYGLFDTDEIENKIFQLLAGDFLTKQVVEKKDWFNNVKKTEKLHIERPLLYFQVNDKYMFGYLYKIGNYLVITKSKNSDKEATIIEWNSVSSVSSAPPANFELKS